MKKLKLTPVRFILLLGVFHLLGASLSFASNLDASWRMGLGGVDSQDHQTNSKFVSFDIEAKMKYWLQSSAYLTFDPKIKFENGSFQSIDGARKNETGLYISEAGAHWLFGSASYLSAGALNQGSTHSGLLISHQAFPAVRADVQIFRVGNFATSVNVQQAIPTSNSLATNTTGVESTPRFLSASLGLNYETPNYHWNTRVGAFAFDNLPSAVAYESSLQGNTVLSLTESESTFVYKYEGVEAMTDLRVPMARGWDLLGKAAYIQNNKSIRSLNQAYMAGLGSEFFFTGQKSLTVEGSAFRIEPDAVVAYFNSPKYFNTNRVGYRLESFMNFRKSAFRIGVGYTDAQIIYLNPVQSREKSLMLMLETFYATI